MLIFQYLFLSVVGARIIRISLTLHLTCIHPCIIVGIEFFLFFEIKINLVSKNLNASPNPLEDCGEEEKNSVLLIVKYFNVRVKGVLHNKLCISQVI